MSPTPEKVGQGLENPQRRWGEAREECVKILSRAVEEAGWTLSARLQGEHVGVLWRGFIVDDYCIHPLVSTEPKEGKPERYYAIGGNGLNSLYEVSVNEDGYLVYWDRGSLKTKGYSTLPDSWLSSVGNHPVIRNNVKYFNYGAIVFSSQESKEFGISSLINSYKKEFIERNAVFMLLTGLKKAGGLI